MSLQDEARVHAAKYARFVSEVDAPTLKKAFNQSAELLLKSADEIDRLTAELKKETHRADSWVKAVRDLEQSKPQP